MKPIKIRPIRLCITVLAWLLVIPFCGFSQSLDEIEQMSHLNDRHEHRQNWGSYLKQSDSEFQLVFSGLFLAYKTFFSSQDANHCSFYPSCSVYGIEAIRKQGPVVGLMNWFDRYSRCNGLSPESYDRHPETQLLYDPL